MEPNNDDDTKSSINEDGPPAEAAEPTEGDQNLSPINRKFLNRQAFESSPER
jgi:hypothetical protein